MCFKLTKHILILEKNNGARFFLLSAVIIFLFQLILKIDITQHISINYVSMGELDCSLHVLSFVVKIIHLIYE